jgi:hypothetical protein
MRHMDERHAYRWAALIDGEGSIIVRARSKSKRKYVTIVVSQNDRRLLDRAVEYAHCGAI